METDRRGTETPFVCPIALERIRDPVIMLDGFIYERMSVTKAIESRDPLKPPTSLLHGGALPFACMGVWSTRHGRPGMRLGDQVCPLTLEPFAVPVFYTADGETYECDALLQRIECERKTAADEFWHQTPFGRRIARAACDDGRVGDDRAFIIPHRALAAALGLNMDRTVEACEVAIESPQRPPASMVQAFARPRVRLLSLINALGQAPNNRRESLWADMYHEMVACGLPTIRKGVEKYDIVISHADLTGVSMGSPPKEAVFYDCDLRNCVFRANISHCQFIMCDMRGSVFLPSVPWYDFDGLTPDTLSAYGRDVAFCGSDLDRASFAANTRMCVGDTNRTTKEFVEVVAEIRARGGRFRRLVSIHTQAH